MSAPAAIARRWRVGAFTCELSMPRPERGAALIVEITWSPHVPASLSRAERRQYEAGRDKALRAIATLIAAEANAQQLVIDPDPCGTPATLH